MNLRDTMPQTAAFIDACCEAFGTDHINGQLRLAMQGAQTFYAEENGLTFGTKFAPEDPAKTISAEQMVIRPTKK